MASSLDKLSSNLKINQFLNVKKYYIGNQLSLWLRKGVYPCEYVHCMKKLDETSLPPKVAFYSKLSGEGITDEDYQNAQTVWKEYNIETMKDYYNLYNLSAVLLLTDIFENFRNISTNNYRLDPAWYFSAPGLAWDAALKITKVQLELLIDPDMLLIIEIIIRRQHGFLSRKSTTSNLLEALNDWTIHLTNKQSTDVAYFDFSKAFDTVSHVKLFEKLKAVGLTGNLLSG